MICVHCREPLLERESRMCGARKAVGGQCFPGHVVNFAGQQANREGAIQAAEHDVVEALRERRRVVGHGEVDGRALASAGTRLDEALAVVDALLSPLPSPEDLGRRGLAYGMSSEAAVVIGTQDWTDCLRWVAGLGPDVAGELGYTCNSVKLESWADELEARK